MWDRTRFLVSTAATILAPAWNLCLIEANWLLSRVPIVTKGENSTALGNIQGKAQVTGASTSPNLHQSPYFFSSSWALTLSSQPSIEPDSCLCCSLWNRRTLAYLRNIHHRIWECSVRYTRQLLGTCHWRLKPWQHVLFWDLESLSSFWISRVVFFGWGESYQWRFMHFLLVCPWLWGALGWSILENIGQRKLLTCERGWALTGQRGCFAFFLLMVVHSWRGWLSLESNHSPWIWGSCHCESTLEHDDSCTKQMQFRLSWRCNAEKRSSSFGGDLCWYQVSGTCRISLEGLSSLEVWTLAKSTAGFT